jgi:hypothetical protein
MTRVNIDIQYQNYFFLISYTASPHISKSNTTENSITHYYLNQHTSSPSTMNFIPSAILFFTALASSASSSYAATVRTMIPV